MPTLGAPLEFSKYEARNIRAHILGAAPSSPVTGQMYYNSGDNTLYWWDGSQWVSARGGAAAIPPATTGALGTIQLAGDLAGTATSPQIAAGAVTDVEVAAANKDGAAGTPSLRTLGTGATQAMPGNTTVTPADATTGVKGIVQLAGDLAGTATSPQIAAGVITHNEVATANKDGADNTPGMRSLGYVAGKALPGVSPLNWIGIPDGDVVMNNWKLTGVKDPTAAQDAATKAYVDNVAQGLDAKASVRAATTANITLSGTQAVDGVTLAANDRILVKDQSTQGQNGVYIVAAGAWSRAPDVDAWNELVSAFVFVESGTVNADSGWVSTVDPGGTLGTTAVTWSQFSGAGQITAGAGMTKTGNTLDVGQGAGITVAADSVGIATNGVTNAMLADGAVNLGSADVQGTLQIANGGTGAVNAGSARLGMQAATYYQATGPSSGGTSWSIPVLTHGCGPACVVQVCDVATNVVELPDVTVTAAGNVTLTWGASVTANSKRVTIVGGG